MGIMLRLVLHLVMPCFRMYGDYVTMPRRVTCSDGGERLVILLSLRIGGDACPAGGVGDFMTCLPLGA